jgi:hypothetical protein
MQYVSYGLLPHFLFFILWITDFILSDISKTTLLSYYLLLWRHRSYWEGLIFEKKRFFKSCGLRTFTKKRQTSADTIFFLFNFLRWKTALFDPKLVSLPVRNMFNQILPKLAIMFLFLPFTLLLIQFFPV